MKIKKKRVGKYTMRQNINGVNVSTYLTMEHLKMLEKMVKEGKAQTRSEAVRIVMEDYLRKEKKRIAREQWKNGK